LGEVQHRSTTLETRAYYDVYVPDDAATGGRPVLIATHGYGGDKSSMMRAARRIAPTGFAIASLQGIHQHVVRPLPDENGFQPTQLGYGFGWLTNFEPQESVALHHRAVDAVIDDLAGQAGVDRSRVFLMGFSQSVAINYRYAFTYPERVRGVVAICGGVPGDWEDEGRYRSGPVDVLVIGGERDEYYPPERVCANSARLERRARCVDLHILDIGHEMPRTEFDLISQWLRARGGGE
jgi:predicted esterase